MIAEFLKKEEIEFELSEKTYKIIVTETVELKYQINLTRLLGEAEILVVEF